LYCDVRADMYERRETRVNSGKTTKKPEWRTVLLFLSFSVTSSISLVVHGVVLTGVGSFNLSAYWCSLMSVALFPSLNYIFCLLEHVFAFVTYLFRSG